MKFREFCDRTTFLLLLCFFWSLLLVSRFHAHSGLVFIFASLFLKITGTTGGAQVLRNLQSIAGLLQEGAQKSVHVHQLNCGLPWCERKAVFET